MNLEKRLNRIENTLHEFDSVEMVMSQLTDDELLAIIGNDAKWLSHLSDAQLEEIINKP